MNIPQAIISLSSCPKTYSRDLDKARTPEQTLAFVRQRLEEFGADIYAGSVRADKGRLGIPVYMGMCGSDARSIMPVRKQMGKGSSMAQAQASALMEVMERFAFFSFWQNSGKFYKSSWKQAKKQFGKSLIPVASILESVNDPELNEKIAEDLLDLHDWQFYPATDLSRNQISWLPLDWFRLLGEFNGSSAGNTTEESLLQGLSELVERHVCAIIDRDRPQLPTIDPISSTDSVLNSLVAAFQRNGINLALKDFSLNMPVPTVAALAWDPATFPASSEIVFTAGTATSPVKAAIRAITEVAQLGGDFCSSSCYEASGLPKFTSLEETLWLSAGPRIPLSELPDISASDIKDELQTLIEKLAPRHVYAIETTHPGLGIPAHYALVPGLQFRERDKNQCLGLFIGRKLAEEAPAQKAMYGLELLGKAYPEAHFLPFFHGLLALRENRLPMAASFFEKSLPMQPDPDSRALAAFYAGYAKTKMEQWQDALPFLEQAYLASPQFKEICNLLGISCFKLKDYENAKTWFEKALALDKGSAVDLANRGLCHKFLGEKENAIADLTSALELDPGLDFARTHLYELLA